MPLAPAQLPALGVSLLKSCLVQAGIDTEIYYGSLHFLDFLSRRWPLEHILSDYDQLANASDYGEDFFAEALWGRRAGELDSKLRALGQVPEVAAYVEYAHDVLGTSPELLQKKVRTVLHRLRSYLDDAPAFINAAHASRDWGRYDVVGFSSTYYQNVASLALAQRIKASHPGTHIVFGGANTDGEMGWQMMRSFDAVDAVIQGEAEVGLVRYVKALRSEDELDGVPGLIYRSESAELERGAPVFLQTAMDDLPIPDFADYFAQMPGTAPLDKAAFRLPMEIGRGCWWGALHHCVFCGLNAESMRFRKKSIERTLAEFRVLQQRYGVKSFVLVDNIVDRQFIHDLLPQLEDDGLTLFCETKANLTEADVKQLARAGVRTIQPGIENLSTEILSLMKKGVSGIQNVQLLKWCRQYRILPFWSILYGFAHEPTQAYLDALAHFDSLHHLPPPVAPYRVRMDRFSPYFNQHQAYGLTNLVPTDVTRRAYQGLSEEAVFHMSYSFTFDLPQGNSIPYLEQLLSAVKHWQRAFVSGVSLEQHVGREVTILLDTRYGRRSYLLMGLGHHLYKAMRHARSFQTLRQVFDTLAKAPTRFDRLDGQLMLWSAELGAEPIAPPTSASMLDGFLSALVQRKLVLDMDDRFLALALDAENPSGTT